MLFSDLCENWCLILSEEQRDLLFENRVMGRYSKRKEVA